MVSTSMVFWIKKEGSERTGYPKMAVNLSRGHLKTKKNTVLIFFLILLGG